jgi:hypothetical protein
MYRYPDDGRLAEVLIANRIRSHSVMKTLRPNPVAQRELRLFGKYRVLFNVDQENEKVTIMLVGEKRGNSLLRLHWNMAADRATRSLTDSASMRFKYSA